MQQIRPDGTILTVVHLAYPTSDDHRIACTPRMTELGQTMIHPGRQHTNDPRAVTCPACKRTEKYAEMKRLTDAL